MAKRKAKESKPLPEKSPDYSGRVAWECVLTAPVLREMRISALVGHGAINVDKFIHVVETLEEILETAAKKQIKPRFNTSTVIDKNLAAEQVKDVILAIDEAREEAIDEAKKAEKDFDSRYDDAVKEAGNEASAHEVEIAEHCKIIDELRRRAELAEHELTKSAPDVNVELRAKLIERDYQVVQVAQDHELTKLALRVSDSLLVERDAEIEQLSAMLAAMRAKKPLKMRKS